MATVSGMLLIRGTKEAAMAFNDFAIVFGLFSARSRERCFKDERKENSLRCKI